ncbi:MAG: extracellular solute-binding protein [Planctomycetota bacterium]
MEPEQLSATARSIAFTRRAAIAGLGAAAAGLLLFGPRPRDDTPPGRVVVDYWEKWTGSEGVAMRRLVDEFNATQDRIYVRYLTIGAIDQKAMIAIAGGAPPDIVGLWNFNLPAFAEAGALMPLDDLAAASGISRADYASGVWPMLMHQQQLWGLISTCGSLALYLNIDAIEAAGVTGDAVRRGPQTIDELDLLHERLLATDTRGRIERVGFIHTDPGWWSWLWGYHFGGMLVNTTGTQATALSPQNVAAYEWVRSYPARHGVEALQLFQSGLGFYGTALQPFLTGQVATTIQGPWLANLIEAFAPGLRYRAVPMPVEASVYDPDRPVGLLDGDVLAIPRGASQPEAAFEFMLWLQDRQRLESLASAHGKNSPLYDASRGFLDNHPNRSIDVHGQLANSERAFLFPRVRVWPRYVAEFDAGFQSLWQLRKSPEAMLRDIQAVAQSALDDAAEMRQLRARSDAS